MKVVVIGSGVGGLVAATRLAILGHQVQIFEARDEAGGLASGFDAAGLSFDGGPYILLDRPGLEWALERVGLDVSSLHLIRTENLYEVRGSDGRDPVRIFLDLKRTEDELERAWPGAGRAYGNFVSKMDSIRTRLAPLLRVSRPNLMELARRGSLSVAPFLIRSLAGVLKESRLPPGVVNAIAIWTHIAGQPLDAAPSVMAFIPALLHRVGAFLPEGGMRVIAPLLAANAANRGVEIRYRTPVKKIRTGNGRVNGVELHDGSIVPCQAVVSNYHGIGTYDEMVDVPDHVRSRMRKLPLQSPGMCAYVSAGGEPGDSYLSFLLDSQDRVRLRVSTAAVDSRMRSKDRFPVRLITPMQHEQAMSAGEAGQRSELQRILNESWWREGLSDAEVVALRTIRGWGEAMNLYKDSMNPAMTRTLMLRGRIAHRSPWVRGLYLAGASTHPGQWVSFCAISGVLAADVLHADRR
jgi:phytoene dehydrogenase-like protein